MKKNEIGTNKFVLDIRKRKSIQTINFIIKDLKLETVTQLSDLLGYERPEKLYKVLRGEHAISKKLAVEINTKFPQYSIDSILSGELGTLEASYIPGEKINKFTKSQILDEIINYLGMDGDKQLAKSLNVNDDLIKFWRKEDILDYDLIINKYPFISGDWLIKGVGEMITEKRYGTQEDLQEIYSLVEKMELKQEAFYELMITIHDNEEESSEELDAVSKFKDMLDSIN